MPGRPDFLEKSLKGAEPAELLAMMAQVSSLEQAIHAREHELINKLMSDPRTKDELLKKVFAHRDRAVANKLREMGIDPTVPSTITDDAWSPAIERAVHLYDPRAAQLMAIMIGEENYEEGP